VHCFFESVLSATRFKLRGGATHLRWVKSEFDHNACDAILLVRAFRAKVFNADSGGEFFGR